MTHPRPHPRVTGTYEAVQGIPCESCDKPAAFRFKVRNWVVKACSRACAERAVRWGAEVVR